MTLIIKKPTGAKLVLRKELPADAEADAYIAAVEAADGQALEPGVKFAIKNFVLCCKQDGIWNAIKASCILAGARTLNGALVPLVGTAPTNFNFVSDDYNRKTGLVGNESTKYLDSNRADNADGQNNSHLAVFVSQAGSGGAGTSQAYASVGTTSSSSFRTISALNQFSGFTGLSQYNRSSSFNGNISLNATGFLGNSRDSASSFTRRDLGSSTTVSASSTAPGDTTIGIFVERRNGVVFGRYANARLAFYSIGESLDLALLDARVTDLINAIGAAIP